MKYRKLRDDVLHLTIDRQKSYYTEKAFTPETWRELNVNAANLERKLSRRGIRTVHVLYYDELQNLFGQLKDVKKELMRSKEYEDIICSNAWFENPIPKNFSLMATKSECSAYKCSPLLEFILTKKFKAVILSGIFEAESNRAIGGIGECCVSLTGRDLARREIHVTIAAEATNAAVAPTIIGARGYASTLDRRRGLHSEFNVGVDPIEDILDTLDNRLAFKHAPVIRTPVYV